MHAALKTRGCRADNTPHRQTMVNNTTDSTHMHEAIQPIVVAKRGRIAEAFKEFDVNGARLPK